MIPSSVFLSPSLSLSAEDMMSGGACACVACVALFGACLGKFFFLDIHFGSPSSSFFGVVVFLEGIPCDIVSSFFFFFRKETCLFTSTMYYSIPGRFAWQCMASWLLAGCILGERGGVLYSSLVLFASCAALRCGLRARLLWCGLSICLTAWLSGLDGVWADRLDGVGYLLGLVRLVVLDSDGVYV